MEKILIGLIDSSIIASIIILVVLVLRPFIKKLPKWVNLVLWSVVALRLIMPVGFESNFSLLPDIDGMRSGYTEVIFGNDNNAVEKYSVHEEMQDTEYSGKNTIENLTPDIGKTNIEKADKEKADAGIFNTESETAGLDPADILSIIYVSGCLIALAYLLISIFRLKRTVRFSVPANLPYNLAKQSLALIYVCEGVKSPFIMGLFRTKLYIPEGMNISTLEYVIKHENAHIRHFDQIWKMAGFILLLIYWFNPLMWVAFVCFTKDLELACDERAAGKLSQKERAGYSEALLECAIHNRIIAVCPLAFGETGVKERVKAVISLKKPLKIVLVSVAVGCALFALCFLTDPVSAKENDGNNIEDTFNADEKTPYLDAERSNESADTRNSFTESNAYTDYTDEDTQNITENYGITPTGTIGKQTSFSIVDVQELYGQETKNDESTDYDINEDTNVDTNEDLLPNIENQSLVTEDDNKTEKPSDENAIIPYSIITIKDGAFAGTESIKHVSIPDTVETIGSEAFRRCSNLSSVDIPGSVTSIGHHAFTECNLETVVFPESVQQIGVSALSYNRNLRYCKWSSQVAGIPDYMFTGDEALTDIALDGNTTWIGNGAFEQCLSLEKIALPDTVKYIGYSAFSYTGLKEIVIPDGVERIEANTFSYCTELERVYLPESVTFIGDYAFGNCVNLKEINIPDSVTEISQNAFWLCNNLTDDVKADIRAVNKKVRFDYVK
ncbi:MAG: leucine-rich repeat protein [Lachnospiraceae bacterium]|nr:leucine-rich repeat protein [Lachnospiraceae bacterium]